MDNRRRNLKIINYQQKTLTGFYGIKNAVNFNLIPLIIFLIKNRK